jgi:hypothetical protein
MSITIADIEHKARKAAEARAALKELVSLLDEETRVLRNLYRKRLIKLTEEAARAQDVLLEQVKEAPELFTKPRSVTFHGIKCGWAKGIGKLVIEDEARTIALIQKHFPELMDTLVKITMAPVKTEIAKLPVNDLKRIGGKIEDTDDIAFVKTMDSEIDKLVTALMASFCEGSA